MLLSKQNDLLYILNINSLILKDLKYIILFKNLS